MSDPDFNWDQWMQFAAVTDVGMRRSNNQDSHRVAITGGVEEWRRRGHLFIVADGMGAHAAGELASGLAVEGVPHHYQKYHDLSPPEALQKAIVETNADVHRRGQANSDFHNMGTTTSVLVVLPQGALIGHIGDSRVYRLRGDRLEQMTFDHSLVWELRAAGQLPKDTDSGHGIPKNVITRSLGPNATIQVDMEGPHPIEVGDTFMICSDGLTGEVKDEELGVILANLEPRESARMLVDLANLRGGRDNTTVVVVKILAPEMTTRGSGAEPLVLRGERRPQADRLQPLVWAAAAALLLGAGALWAAQRPWYALALAVGGALTGGYGLLRKFAPLGGGISLGSRRLGKGPYTQRQCTADKSFVERLAETAEELRQAADHEKWAIDRERFEHHCSQAEAAQQLRRYGDAVGEFSRGISFMMEELRNQGLRQPRSQKPTRGQEFPSPDDSVLD